MIRLALVVILIAVSVLTGCSQPNGCEDLTPNGCEDLTPIQLIDNLPTTEVQTADDLVFTPGGVAYRANVHQQGEEDRWPAIETIAVEIHRGNETTNLRYRKDIEAAAGETKYNIYYLSGGSGFENGPLDFYSDNVPEGIELHQFGQGGLGLPGTLVSALVIEISENMAPGEYQFQVGICADQVDYGMFPCFVTVVDTPTLSVPASSPLVVMELRHLMGGTRNYLEIYEDGTIMYILDEGLRFPAPDRPATRTWKLGQLEEEELNGLLEFIGSSGFDSLDSYYSFPGLPIENGPSGGITMGDMSLSISVALPGLTKTVNANSYLSPDNGLSYPDMSYPLNEIYARLYEIGGSTSKVIQQDI